MKENYFEIIDTEEKAYWLGFLYADGNVWTGSNHYTISLCLSSKDENHVYRLANTLELKGRVRKNENRNCTTLSFGSKKMFYDLVNKGCVPRKSLVLKFPTEEQVPKHLIRHFIRGYFDGDGCLSFTSVMNKRSDLKNDKLYKREKWTIKILGTQEFLLGVKKFFKESNLETSITKHSNSKIYQIKCGGNLKIKNLMSNFYKDNKISLSRKQEKYEMLMNY